MKMNPTIFRGILRQIRTMSGRLPKKESFHCLIFIHIDILAESSDKEECKIDAELQLLAAGRVVKRLDYAS